MNFEIRAMDEDDLDGVLNLTAASIEAPRWTRRDYERTLPSATASHLQTAPWVAQAESRLVGFSVVRWLAGEPAAEIENLLVEQHHRRQGIGSALIRACIGWAARTGASAVRLEVRASNAAALALYGGLGFVPVGRRSAYYASPAEDACILQAPAPL